MSRWRSLRCEIVPPKPIQEQLRRGLPPQSRRSRSGTAPRSTSQAGAAPMSTGRNRGACAFVLNWYGCARVRIPCGVCGKSMCTARRLEGGTRFVRRRVPRHPTARASSLAESTRLWFELLRRVSAKTEVPAPWACVLIGTRSARRRPSNRPEACRQDRG